MDWDVFISHASEDKESLVIPLAQSLSNLKVKVWFDQFTLEPGDSLSRSIDKGLAKSKFGIVVISKSFISKGWPEYELRGLNIREIGGKEKVIIPIWHGVTFEEVIQFSPSLADKLAIDTSKLEIHEIVVKLIKIIRPDIFENLARIISEEQLRNEAPKVRVDFSELVKHIDLKRPVRHKSLPDSLLIRIKNIQRIIRDVYPYSLEETIENFQRDTNPEREVIIWESIIAAYLDAIYEKEYGLDERTEVFRVLLLLSTGNLNEKFISTLSHLDTEKINEIKECYNIVLPKINI